MFQSSKSNPVDTSRVEFGKPCAVRFNIMVVRETGSGKTTFLRTLFKKYCTSDIFFKSDLYSMTVKTVTIEEIGSFVLESPAQDCEVHLFDSPGYGDYINNQNAIEVVKDHLMTSHDAWYGMNGNGRLEKERNAADNRIHCVFYFIVPHRIKFIDREFIKQLSGLAPIVLVVAKADTMTLDERMSHLLAVRKLVKELSAECGFPIAYDFKEDAHDFMPEVEPAAVTTTTSVPEPARAAPAGRIPLHAKQAHAEYLDLSNCIDEDSPHMAVANEVAAAPASPRELTGLPKIRDAFAVVCDTSDKGKREYPWGSLDIYDERHSDFRRLQRLIFESCNINKLRDMTQVMTLLRHSTTPPPPYSTNPAAPAQEPVQETSQVSKKVATWRTFFASITTSLMTAKGAVDKIVLALFWMVLPAALVYFFFEFHR